MAELPGMNSDSTTTIKVLKEALERFRDERNWRQFHDPKNLSEAISIEASELLELFLWKSVADVQRLLKSDAEYRRAIEDELADVICFSLNFANVANIDVAQAVFKKMDSNGLKYPIKKVKGKATKYTRL